MRRAVPVLLAVLVTGCATKRDIRDMQSDIQQLDAGQDSIYALLSMQNRQILDSLQVTTDQLLNVRGDLANQLQQLRDQLVQVGELTSQVQIRLNQLDQQLADAVRSGVPAGGGAGAGGAAGAGDAGGTAGAGGSAGGAASGDTFSMAEQFYEIGLEQIQLGNAATARRALQSVVDSFPAHPMAPEAQRQIGETYAMDREFDQAMRSFERVVERWPNAEAAPRALYRAGVIARQQGQQDQAREYFRRVISGYPSSDARRLAEEALDQL